MQLYAGNPVYARQIIFHCSATVCTCSRQLAWEPFSDPSGAPQLMDAAALSQKTIADLAVLLKHMMQAQSVSFKKALEEYKAA